MILKINFVLFFCCSLLLAGEWVAMYENITLYEDDLYSYVSKKDWLEIKDINKKEGLLLDFTKQRVGVIKAKELGLQYNQKNQKKLKNRFHGLVVNEYYMRNFLGSLVPGQGLFFCKQNLKKEVFVKHVLFPLNDASLELATATKKDIVAGISFGPLALQHSIDPSVKQNKGVLGWISIGQTVPKFQNKIFSLCVGCVDVVETSFGYHVVQIDSARSSKYADLGGAEYNDWAFRFATAYIEEDLAIVAAKHDSSLVQDRGVFISRYQLKVLIDLIEKEKMVSGKEKARREVDVLGVIENFSGVVAKYKGELLSGAWFVNKINNGLYQKNTYYESVDQLYNDFMRIIIRDIVFDLGIKGRIDKGFSFSQQFNSIEQDILYKAFVSYLINSTSEPTDTDVDLYYTTNETVQPTPSLEAVRAILLQKKQKQTQALFDKEITSKTSLNFLWLNNE